MKNKCNGFSLAELLIVVAIIGVLVAVTIPVFSRQLEKSREATDLANVRAKYAEVKAEAMTATTAYPIKESVKLKQKQSDWQYYEPVVIAGIIHYKHDGNTDHWEGVPGAGGECIISYTPSSEGLKFIWSGGTVGDSGTGTSIKFNENFHEVLDETGFKKKYQQSMFEIDSRSPKSVMVSEVQKHLDQNSLLKYGTWAYLADTRSDVKDQAYMFWTSVDTNAVGADQKIPVIISKEGGGFYVSESTTATRHSNNGDYIAIADHLYNYNYYKPYIDGKTKYDTLEDAYKAYENLLKTDSRYTQYKNTLPK